MIRRHPRSTRTDTLFPYTTLFRSRAATVTAVHPSSRYGELSIRGGLVKSFNEKPQVTEGWINGGFMVFERRAFDGLSAADNISLEVGVLEDLARHGELAVYQHDGFWQSMDTYREMCLLNELWTSGQAPWRIWERHRLSDRKSTRLNSSH